MVLLVHPMDSGSRVGPLPTGEDRLEVIPASHLRGSWLGRAVLLWFRRLFLFRLPSRFLALLVKPRVTGRVVGSILVWSDRSSSRVKRPRLQ